MREKLTIFSDDFLCFNGQDYVARNPLAELLNELSAYFDIVLSSPLTQWDNNKKPENYTNIGDEIVCSPRPFYDSVAGFFKKFPILFIPTLRNVSLNVKNSDIVMLRVPSPIGIIVYLYTELYSKPIFLYVAGDEKLVAMMGGKYKGFKKTLAFFAANIFARLTRFVARDTLVFSNGKALLNKLKTGSNKCVNFIPSLIKKENIFFRKDTCQNRSIKLLFVGVLIPVKGLLYLLEVLKILQEKGINVYLTVVGEGPHRTQLSAAAQKLRVGNFVQFKGHLRFGNQLFLIYRESDIFVLPSLSEGLPKVLSEAMASGLPIVATGVGGVPDIIENKKTGILVPPGSAEKISEAIEEIISDSELRKNLIKNGYKFIKNHTIEKQAKFMAATIKHYFNQNKI